jgi:hypothetical protein
MFRIDNRKPYLYGALSGLVLVASVAFSGNYFGASTTFARAAAFFEGLILPERVLNNVYFQKHAPAIDWQLLFLVGIFLGALASSLISGDFRKNLDSRHVEGKDGFGMARRACGPLREESLSS